LWYKLLEGIDEKEESGRLHIPYQKHSLKPILVRYIYHKNEKGKPSEIDLPLLKNDITNILGR
jgi:hypothetical protein